MLSPLFPYSLSGVIWYQGESDTTVAEAKIYKDELECLIDTVRKEDKDEKLPFVIVQIADFDLRRDDGWYGVQAAQAKAAAEIPDCALAVCRDVCESNEIHPPTKSKLAERIADNL
jgi:sialate O-acetylesterase